MKDIQIISRADDLGSSNSANQAIELVSNAGFIKNVSIMAPGAYVKQAASLMSERKDICFGMHTTLNSEWDKVKWGPITQLTQKSGLVDENGYFLSDPPQFVTTKPSIETILKEVDAQLEYLHSLGFAIQYIDSHMLPEIYVDGLDEAMRSFADEKGLLYHMNYYSLPPGHKEGLQAPSGIPDFFGTLESGQYFFVCHPSLDTKEMQQTGNSLFRGQDIAKIRAQETEVFSNVEIIKKLNEVGCTGIRYDEAIADKSLTVSDIIKAMG